jgi:hypothetical protein
MFIKTNEKRKRKKKEGKRLYSHRSQKKIKNKRKTRRKKEAQRKNGPDGIRIGQPIF